MVPRVAVAATTSKEPAVFGKGVYFAEQACKAFQYSEDYLLVCEVAIGTPEKRLHVTADDTTIVYDAEIDGLRVKGGEAREGMRSAEHRPGEPYGHWERVVYHATQCKPVYLVRMKNRSPGGGV